MPGRTGPASVPPAQAARPACAHLAGGWLRFAAGHFSSGLDAFIETNALTGGK